jgi:catechol 2,3-dioxygenase-like lactoylglutathione lyase family enzyme
MSVEVGRTASVQLKTVSIDCSDADEQAAFYSRLLGWTIDRRGDVDAVSGRSGWVTLPNPGGGIGLAFGRAEWYEPPTWPQAKVVDEDDAFRGRRARPCRSRRAGLGRGGFSRTSPARPGPDQVRVMLDPAGHPFCLYQLQ